MLRGATCICRDTRMCHYFVYFFRLLPNFWVPFWAYSGFLGIIFFVVKFDFFKNNPDFWVLILIFY